MVDTATDALEDNFEQEYKEQLLDATHALAVNRCRRTLEHSRRSTVFVVTHESMYMPSVVRGRIGGALSNTRTDDSKGPIGTKQSLIELTDGMTDEDDAWRRALDDARGTTNVKPEALQAVRARWRWTRRGEI